MATPRFRDADLSVTIWQLMALRSAKNSGLKVPSSAIADAIEYLKLPPTSPNLITKASLSIKNQALPINLEDIPSTPTAAGLLAMQECVVNTNPPLF